MMKKKIAFMIPSLVGGGAEKVLVNLVNNLDQNKFDVTLKVLFDGGENKQYLRPHIKYEYVFKKIFRGNIHLLKIATPQYLFKKIFTEEYDYVVSYLEGPTTRIVAGCQNKNTKIINWVHNEFYTSKSLISSYRSEKELIKCYSAYNSTVFVSQVAEQAFETTFPMLKNFKVLYNTVETNEIVEKSLQKVEEKYFLPEKINLISVGRFISQKGFERLINIVAKLIHHDQLPINLYLLGKGELQDKYEDLSQKLGIQDNITYLGYQENPYKYVQKADVFVCSSLHEGFSTAVSESVIVGTPVITTDCSGMKEILGENNEYGIVCDNDESMLYEAVRSYLTDKNVQQYCEKKVIERKSLFDTQKSVKAVEDYLLSL